MLQRLVILAAVSALAPLFAPLPASAQAAKILRCDQEGIVFFYSVGPAEFRHWSLKNFSLRELLINECATRGTTCTWDQGTLVLRTPAYLLTFNTTTGAYDYSAPPGASPTTYQCTHVPSSPK